MSDGEGNGEEEGKSDEASPKTKWGKANSGRHHGHQHRAACAGDETGPSCDGGCRGDSGRTAPKASSMLWGTPRVAKVTTTSCAW